MKLVNIGQDSMDTDITGIFSYQLIADSIISAPLAMCQVSLAS